MRFFLLSITAFLFCIGCSKKEDGDVYPSNFRVDGLSDLTISNSEFGNIPFLNLKLSPIGKYPEHVSLSISGLPSGMSYTLSNVSGYPTFNTKLSFYDTSAAAGQYTLKLICDGSVTGRSVCQFNMTVKPFIDMTSLVTGVYTKTNSACASTGYYTDSISAVPGMPGRFQVNNFENTGGKLVVDIDCYSIEMHIPEQTVGGIKISGGGGEYLGPQTFFIDYAKDMNNGNCTTIFLR